MSKKKQKGPPGSNNPSGKNVPHLTDKQKRFARELVYNDGSKTKTQCAIDAGYSKTRAGVSAAELTNPRKYPLVVRHIQEMQGELQQKFDVTFDRHIRNWLRSVTKH